MGIFDEFKQQMIKQLNNYHSQVLNYLNLDMSSVNVNALTSMVNKTMAQTIMQA